jgi:hypothetical protein
MTRPTATNATRGKSRRREVVAIRVWAMATGRVTEFMNPSLAAE